MQADSPGIWTQVKVSTKIVDVPYNQTQQTKLNQESGILCILS